MIKVNLGSGFHGLPDWENLDNSALARLSRIKGLIPLMVRLKFLPAFYAGIKWPPIRLVDCTKRLPFRDGEVDWVYSSHFLEHLKRYEAAALLKECLRILKPGGRIRVVVPDLRALAKKYLEGTGGFEGPPSDPVLPYTLADCLSANFYPQELNQVNPPGLVTRIQERYLRRHQWLYDFESMAKLFDWAGFEGVRESRFRQSEMPNVDFLDCHPDASLHVEARRP